jgi:hypothetical protein
MVRGPILPMNMVKIMMYFPASDIKGVIPVDKPTVPNADTSSNNKSRNPKLGSVIKRAIKENTINTVENNTIE